MRRPLAETPKHQAPSLFHGEELVNLCWHKQKVALDVFMYGKKQIVSWTKVQDMKLLKNAFERTCAAMTPVFYDACDSMFENEDQMIQDYLNNKPYTKMCQNIGICSKKLPGGIPGAKKAKRL